MKILLINLQLREMLISYYFISKNSSRITKNQIFFPHLNCLLILTVFWENICKHQDCNIVEIPNLGLLQISMNNIFVYFKTYENLSSISSTLLKSIYCNYLRARFFLLTYGELSSSASLNNLVPSLRKS